LKLYIKRIEKFDTKTGLLFLVPLERLTDLSSRTVRDR